MSRVRYAETLQVDVADGIQVEHICLESEAVSCDGRVRGARVGPALTVASPFRGCRTELAVLDGHRLAIRTRRPRGIDRQYVVDLRFLDDAPETRRRIAWRCWLASAALATLALTGDWLAAVPGVPPLLHAGPAGPLLFLLAAACVGVLALYRTHETLLYRSVHGRSILVEVTGNLGCSRAAVSFVAEIAGRIADARARAAQSKQRFLCDELHEHRRLLGEGVISKAGYERGKQRILQSHG